MTIDKSYLSKLQSIKHDDVKVLLKNSYRGIWETAIKKYSDSAHFILELLQNADDTKATYAEFILEEGGLWFTHNGIERFTISNPETEEEDSTKGKLGHVNAITSIGNSSKIDEQKIGKFGIGFKAVFAYSDTPHIHDDGISFKLEKFIIPTEITPEYVYRKPRETLFYFPFNRTEKTKEIAYREIEEKLRSLLYPTLFLTNLQIINWKSIESKGSYSKNIVKIERIDDIQSELIELVNEKDEAKKSERLWLFSREIRDSFHKISVGFFITDKDELETEYNYEAFCFFPTRESTKLSFPIQAPFLLTDNREGIKAGEQWNIDLIQSLANLAADSLMILKKIGIEEKSFFFNDNILELIPSKESDFSEIDNKSKISFKPFFRTIQYKLKTEQLLPGRSGKYFNTANSYWASDTELAELFSDEQLSLLMENPNSGWVFISRSAKLVNHTNKQLEIYIKSIVNEIVEIKKLVRKITANFIESQSDEWILKLYEYLSTRKYLWEDTERLVLKLPILLNQDRKAVIPFDFIQNVANIYLPSDRTTSFDTVYRPFSENKEAVKFFRDIGLSEPDLYAEILKSIIPKYNGNSKIEVTQIWSHFESFFIYFKICPASNLEDYIKKLREVNFVASKIRSKQDERLYCKPEMIYFKNDQLITYFGETPGTLFLDEDFYSEFINSYEQNEFREFLNVLGVLEYPKINKISLDITRENKVRFRLLKYEISKTKLDFQEIIDWHMDGLEAAIKAITPELSVIIWDFLLYQIQHFSLSNPDHLFYGSFCFYPKNRQNQSTVEFESSMAALLRNEKWLYDIDENNVTAEKLSRETINKMYNLKAPAANILLKFLGINDTLVYSLLTAAEREAMNIGMRLMKASISEVELEKILAKHEGTTEVYQDRNGIHKNQNKDETEFEKIFSELKNDILIKRQKEDGIDLIGLPTTESPEPIVDQDDYYKPSVNLQKKIDLLKEITESQIEELTRIDKLNEIVSSSEIYSFAWFKALLELEYLNSSKENTQGKQISIQFAKVEKEPGTERTLILKNPNRYIPHTIEDIGDLIIKLYQGDEFITATVEVVSVKEYTLRAKLKNSVDISNIDLNKISKIVIDIKNPVFILEELIKAFHQLNLDDNFNLQQNLTDKIQFIFGPPGTGKTTYLATDIIIPLMQKDDDLKVLVLTPTNKSADVLTKRIIERMNGDETYFQWLVRLGNTGDAELENSPIVVDKNLDIRKKTKNTTITTVARFAYDYFQTDHQNERLHLKSLHWDYIIVDEASMVASAAIIHILYQRPDASFIIAGDPFQIQPITQIEQWKDMNIYSMVNLDKFVDPVTVPHKYEIKNLKKQYRAIPTIGELFSRFTYNGILEHHRKEVEQKTLNIKNLNFKELNIIKFPVSKHESIFKPNTLKNSNYQIYSALFTVEFVLHLSNQIENNHKDNFRIGVICPYKAQATLIEKILAQQHNVGEKTEVMVGTIHGFQGDECDIIISVFNPPFSISKHPGLFLNKQNILNVSISRARDYLFLLIPDDNTHGIENLYKINEIEELIHKYANNRVSIYHSEKIEEIMFGSRTFVLDNSFATTHQLVNVYSKPEKKYEVRCEEIAVDVQIKS